MEERSEGIQNDCGKDVVLTMDPFAYFLVQPVQFMQQSHFIINNRPHQPICEDLFGRFAYKNMSIFYNKKDKNHFGTNDQDKKKEQQNKQENAALNKKQSANAKSSSVIKRIPITQNAGNMVRISSEQKVKTNANLNDKEGDAANEVVQTKNRNQTTPREYHQDRREMKPTQPRKISQRVEVSNEKVKHDQDDYLQRTQSENSSALTVQSNQRQRVLINKEKLSTINKRSITEQPQLDSRNQFIPEAKGQRHYTYMKHVHNKQENSKERLRNKLGFIFDLANDDQIASVSYYSNSNSAQRETIEQFHRQQQEQEQKPEEPKKLEIKEAKTKETKEMKVVKEVKQVKQVNEVKEAKKERVVERVVQKEKNLVQTKNYEQPIIIIKPPVKHIKKEKQTEDKKTKQQEENISKEIQQQYKFKKRQSDTIKKVDENAEKKAEEPFKKVKITKKLFKEETKTNEQNEFEKIVILPKKSEERNIFEIKLHEVSPKDKQPQPQKQQQRFINKKEVKPNQPKTTKKAPQIIQVKNPIIIPRLKVRQPQHPEQKMRGSDEQLLTLIKQNDRLIQDQKKSIDTKESTNPNKFTYFNSSRRRLRTELDHRCDDFQPLTEEEKKNLIILKRREEEMMNRVREEMLSNPRANTEKIKEYSSNRGFQRQQTLFLHQKSKLKPIQTNEQYNPREMSKMFPTIDSRFKTNESQYSQLSHNPLSLKSFKAVQSIYMKDPSTDQHSLQSHKFQDSLQQLKYKRDLQDRQHYHYQNSRLHTDNSQRDYHTQQVRQKYYRLKNLVERL